MALKNPSMVLFVVIVTAVVVVDAIQEEDRIQQLPNVTFEAPYKMYSGYLKGNDEGTFKMFYWLIESYTDPANAPLLLWLSGGPGCSSVAGALEELGPFYVNRDQHSLYQHVYAWNRHANVLFIESPVGTGFSYNTKDPMNFTVGDDLTAKINLHALSDFFSRVQPKYKSRTFFISGESYAGIYIPTLSRLVIRGINNNSFPNPNFQGMLIGNGYCNVQKLANSLILFHHYHGRIGVNDWAKIKQSCCENGDVDNCDFYANIDYNSTNLNPKNNPCGKSIAKFINMAPNQDEFNFYQDCYQTKVTSQAWRLYSKNINSAESLNYDSTDSQDGFPCFDDEATYTYVNLPEVMKAFHVDEAWINDSRTKWGYCNDPLFYAYPVTYKDTTPVFKDIINEVNISNFRILIYNGDVDTVCNFLGDAWHFRDVASAKNMTANERTAWHFRNQVAGYQQRYTHPHLTLDVLTVKGAGHFVPNDRPGPSLQMITNFINNNGPDYSSTKGFDPMPNILPSKSNEGINLQQHYGAFNAILMCSVLAALFMLY